MKSPPSVSNMAQVSHTSTAWVRQRARHLSPSLTQLAQAAGMTRAYLHRLIDGRIGKPGLSTLQRLAHALQIPVASLVRLWDDPTKIPSNTSRAGHYTSPDDPRDILALLPETAQPQPVAVLAGQRFTQSWYVQNLGCIAWPARQLVRLDAPVHISIRNASGSLQHLQHVYLASLEQAIALPPMPPGALHQVSVDFSAPLHIGTVASIWQVQNLNGQPCYPPSCLLRAVVLVTA